MERALSFKKFRLPSHKIRQLVTGFGACLATDMIVVCGYSVGFMYRQEPHNEWDSGWCFLSGLESQTYLDDPENLAVYDVNTIASYDPDIIPLLDSPIGSAFQRDSITRAFVAVSFLPTE
ncbi:MAG: DUF2185 domain-containing protein [Candidatus Riflebacteria bacterium]|nr:DUF2185 domain-containing protein [Candidatus Riflebacteria bacterium]